MNTTAHEFADYHKPAWGIHSQAPSRQNEVLLNWWWLQEIPGLQMTADKCRLSRIKPDATIIKRVTQNGPKLSNAFNPLIKEIVNIAISFLTPQSY